MWAVVGVESSGGARPAGGADPPGGAELTIEALWLSLRGAAVAEVTAPPSSLRLSAFATPPCSIVTAVAVAPERVVIMTASVRGTSGRGESMSVSARVVVGDAKRTNIVFDAVDA